MQYEIHSRHFHLGDEMKEDIVKKLDNLKRYSPDEPISSRLTLTFEGGRFEGELSMNLKQHQCHARVTHSEPEGAATLAIEGVERQLRRYKDKMKDHRGNADGGLGQAMGADFSGEDTSEEDDNFMLTSMTEEIATDRYNSSTDPFFIYRDSTSGDVTVLYRKDDGEVAVLKPE
jgi:putative sigma-54 modulation protein